MVDKKIILVSMMMMVFFLGCTEQPTETTTTIKAMGEIKIGLVAPLTGGASTTGNDMQEAAELAVEEINAAGGITIGKEKMNVVLVKGDTETNPEQGVKAVTKLITEDDVDILIGGFSSAITYADQVIASENEVPFIITGASSPVITHRDDIDTSYFFHHCPTTDDYGRDTLVFVDEVVRPAVNERFNYSDDRKLRLGMLYQDGKYGGGVLEGAKKAIESEGLMIEIVAEEKFTRSETDYRTALTAIKSAGVDVVYPAAFLNEQTPIVVQGRKDVGLNSIYLSVECNDDPDYYTGVGKLGEYSIQESRFGPYVIPAGSLKPKVEKFRSAFNSKWGSQPSMMGASTYEGVYIAAQAIDEADSLVKEDIKNSLNSLQMDEMVEAMQEGTIAFSDDARESKFQLYMQQLIWDDAVGETRPVIVWPDNLKEADFILPEWYEPSGM